MLVSLLRRSVLATVEKDTTLCLRPSRTTSSRCENFSRGSPRPRDRLEERGGQCLLISHHPEFINYLAVKARPRSSSAR